MEIGQDLTVSAGRAEKSDSVGWRAAAAAPPPARERERDSREIPDLFGIHVQSLEVFVKGKIFMEAWLLLDDTPYHGVWLSSESWGYAGVLPATMEWSGTLLRMLVYVADDAIVRAVSPRMVIPRLLTIHS